MLRTEFQIRKGKYLHRYPVTLDIQEDRIYFQSSPFTLKDEIKSFKGARWHGFETPPRKVWSIENCPRNAFQLKALMGEDVYAWWDRPLVEWQPTRPEAHPHQIDMVRRGLTYHYQIWGAEPGLGKSLAAIELMESSGVDCWWYVGPKSAMESVQREIQKWQLDDTIRLQLMTYEGLTSKMRYDFEGLVPPGGIIFDESDLLKNCTAYRSIAAQSIADLIREKYGFEGYVILMSGTPSAKAPGDLWNQCEIAWPGFLREGSKVAFDRRYGITSQGEDKNGIVYTRLEGWDEEEVRHLPDRYKGLMTVYRKADCLHLPEKKYILEECEPSNKVIRVAKSLTNIAPNTITALTWLRSLSSGFQYQIKPSGKKTCPVCEGSGIYENPEPAVCPCCLGEKEIPDYERETVMVECPKDNVVRKWLDKCESQGRIVLCASFQGSVDRLIDICRGRGWSVSCIDGRGWRVYDNMGNKVRDADALDHWESYEGKVAFVGNPASMSYGLTLTKSSTMLFFDNSFRTVQRLQAEDRIHRIGADETRGATFVDIIHLPVDKLVRDTLKENRKLELLSLDAINETLGEVEEVCEA